MKLTVDGAELHGPRALLPGRARPAHASTTRATSRSAARRSTSPPTSVEAAEDAAGTCPEQAITLLED